MEDYIDFCIDVSGFRHETSDGTEALEAEDGTPWAYRKFPDNIHTFTLVHTNLDADQEKELREFYDDYKGEYVRFVDPRTGIAYGVIMLKPPAVSRMASGLLADVRMELRGKEA